MTKYLLGAATALTLISPGVAAAQSGYVDFAYSTGDVEVGGFEADADGWTLGGAAAWDGGGGLGFQVDALVGNSDVDGGGDSDAFNLGGHLFSRDSGHLIGGFINIGEIDFGGGAELDYWSFGLEGQLYLSKTTLDGALSYSDADDSNAELTAVDVGITHFVNDNFSLGGDLGFGSIEGGGPDSDVSTLGLGAEYQFASAPISVFGGYRHSEIDDINVEADTFTVGVRYNFGGSLFDRNRSGASLRRATGFGRYANVL
jgi:hypothetical protein